MSEESTEVERVDDNGEQMPATTGINSIETMLERAIQSGADVESLTQLVDLYERIEERQAKKDYTNALKTFQSKCPIIEKTTEGYNYQYADLASIVSQIRELLDECGLAYDFDTDLKDGYVVTTCTITHVGGYSKTSTFAIPSEHAKKSSMNFAQKHGSASTYGKRYALCDALGIMTGDEDDDGRSAGGSNRKPPQNNTQPKQPKTVSEAQRKKLHAVGKEHYGKGWNSKRHELCENVTQGRTDSSNDLTPSEANKLIDGIQKRIDAEEQSGVDTDVSDDEIPQ